MPTIYRCSSCGLGFKTGWYHYHREVDGAVAATLLACTQCGAAYMLDHKRAGGRDELYAWGGQVKTEATEYEGIYRDAPGTPKIAKLPTDHDFRPTRETQESARLEGISDEPNLKAFACQFCHGLGTLTNKWPENNCVCPCCKNSTLEAVSSYIT